jgi:hypothetical protein
MAAAIACWHWRLSLALRIIRAGTLSSVFPRFLRLQSVPRAPRLITAVEQNMAELGHASLDESALEQAEFSERTVGAVSAKRDK